MDKRKFLVVVDPSHERHLALERMLEIIRQQAKWEIEFHLILGVESGDKTDADTPMEVVRESQWITQLLKPIEDLGANYTSEFVWTRDWRKSINDAAARHDHVKRGLRRA